MLALVHVPAVVHVGETDLFLATAVEDGLLLRLLEFHERGVDGEAVVVSQAGQHVEVIDIAPVPAANGAFRQAGLRVQYDPRGIEILLHPQAVAAGTGACGVVEREQSGLQLVNTVTAHGTGKTG